MVPLASVSAAMTLRGVDDLRRDDSLCMVPAAESQWVLREDRVSGEPEWPLRLAGSLCIAVSKLLTVSPVVGTPAVWAVVEGLTTESGKPMEYEELKSTDKRGGTSTELTDPPVKSSFGTTSRCFVAPFD